MDFPRADIKPLFIPNEEVNSSIDYLMKTIGKGVIR